MEELLKQCEKNGESLLELGDKMSYLQDLFLRRLQEDKQKNELIHHLESLSTFSVLEPFLSDLILLLDRVSSAEDPMSQSVADELYDILQRRGLSRVNTDSPFDPSIHKAVRLRQDNQVSELVIDSVIRQGYLFNGRCIRPAEVVVARPEKD